MSLRATVRLTAIGLAGGLLATACVVPTVELEGKRCAAAEPGCVAGYRCDRSSNVCVRDEGVARIVLYELRARWATPNAILWTWDRSGAQEDFSFLDLVLAGSAAEARAASGSARVYSSTDNPELARWVLNEATGGDPVRMTFADGLEPDRGYFAVLRATDRDGRVFATDPVEARTAPEAVGGHALFDEVSGGSWPADFVLSDRNAYRGAACMSWTVVCAAGATTCRQNLKLLGMNAAVAVPAGRTPFLELHVRNTGGPSWWSQVNVGLTSGRFFAFGAFTLRQQDGYRRYQLPLSEIVDNGGSLRGALEGAVVDQVFLNGGWTAPGRVNVDAVAVRWW